MNAIVGMTYRKVKGSSRQPIEPPVYVMLDCIEVDAANRILTVWVINARGARIVYAWGRFELMFDYTRLRGQPTILHDRAVWQGLTDALATGIMDSVSRAYDAAPYITERDY